MDILVHGFNVTDPNKSVGKLVKFLPGAEMFNYGWFGIFSVMFRNRREAKKLKRKYGNGHTVWAHSNGCAISVEAARQGMEIDTLVCINPALKVDTDFPDTIKNVIVIHTEHDSPTKAAKFFDTLPILAIFAPNAWGAMGAYGAKDKRAINMDMTKLLKGHSAAFEDDNVPIVVARVKSKMKEL